MATKQEIKDMLTLTSKYVASAILGATVVIGSCTAHKDDCPPLYTNKIGTSGGICISLYTRIESGAKFNGIVISAGVENKGIINGVKLSFANESSKGNGKINGLESSLLDLPKEDPQEINGLQIGLINTTKESGKTTQIGIYNRIIGSNNEIINRSLGLNYSPGKK